MKNCIQCDGEFVKDRKESFKQFSLKKCCSRKCAALYRSSFGVSEETGRKISAAKLGKPNPWNRGERSHWWRGGRTTESVRIRASLEYKNWRRSIFERDEYTCRWCNKKGGWSKEEKRKIVLNADHIKPFSQYPKLRFTIDNGRTLCLDCHLKTPTFGGLSRV